MERTKKLIYFFFVNLKCYALAASIGAVSYFECSSKTHIGFDNILDAMKAAIQSPIKIIRRISVPHLNVGSKVDTKDLRKNGQYLQRASGP